MSCIVGKDVVQVLKRNKDNVCILINTFLLSI